MKYILLVLTSLSLHTAWAQCNKYALHLDSTGYVLINDDSTLNNDHLTVSMYFRTRSTNIQALRPVMRRARCRSATIQP